MSTSAIQGSEVDAAPAPVQDAVAAEARRGLTADPRELSPWLFYDERGSALFEAITELPEYYLTRTERELFARHAREMMTAAAAGARLTVLELGAGTASKSGLLLRTLIEQQGSALYQPIDVSNTALAEAEISLTGALPGLTVQSLVSNYTVAAPVVARNPGERALALYIGSSIGNFDPEQAVGVLLMLRAGLQPGDGLLLGTDLAPGGNKSVSMLLAAYDDAAGITAAFNRNVLTRLNREIGTDFDPERFRHSARWNAGLCRIEMHLEALEPQTIHLPKDAHGEALDLHFTAGQTIHTENSYKFTSTAIAELLGKAGFSVTRVWRDPAERFAVTLAVMD